MDFKKILVTGGSGFIGRYLCNEIQEKLSVSVVSVGRSNINFSKPIKHYSNIDLLNPNRINEIISKEKIDLVIHCSAIAHNKSMQNSNTIKDQNLQMFQNILLAMKKNNVTSVIFMSSIGVLGNHSRSQSFQESHDPDPQNEYTQSKHLCEKLLQSNNDLNYLILRMPLVYGKDAPGNFERLKNIIESKLPLVFGQAKNKRSYLFIENLSDFILTVIQKTNFNNQVYHLADLRPISTSDLIRYFSYFLNVRVLNLNINKKIVKFLFLILNRKLDYERLYNPLEVNISKAKTDFQWSPRFDISEGLKKTLISNLKE